MEVEEDQILELLIIQIQILAQRQKYPAANGHGTAAGIAKFFGILATGGSRDGQIMLKPETIN